MTGNIHVSNSVQVGQVDVAGRRSSQTLVARTILTAGLVLGFLLAPLVIVNNDALAAPIADHECAPCAIEATRFSDSGVGTLFVTKAALSVAAYAARYRALAEFYTIENAALAGARAARFNDSGVGALLALGEPVRRAVKYNDSGLGTLIAVGEPVRRAIQYNDSGLGALLTTREAASAIQ